MNKLVDYAFHWCNETPNAAAWWFEYDGKLECITWRQVGLAVEKLAERLPGTAGERVLSRLPNGIEWAVLDLACQWRRLVHVPIDFRIPSASIECYDRQIRPIAVIEPTFFLSSPVFPGEETVVRGSHDARNASKNLSPPLLSKEADHSPATILFTSGTSGQPRGVVLSHASLLHNAVGKMEAVPQFSSDRRLNLLPFSHAYARTCELSTWLLSGSSILCAKNFEDAVVLASNFQPTLFNAVPYIFEKLLNLQTSTRNLQTSTVSSQLSTFNSQALLGGRLRVLASGGARLPSTTYQFFADRGLPIIQGYGLTEASPVVCSNRVGNARGDCVGPTIRDMELRIDDDQRLFVKGPGVMLGYWDDDQATARKLVDGWLDTGDRAERLLDGSIRILGRCDDRIILSTGEKIDPAIIEEKIGSIDGVRRVVLTGHHEKFVSAVMVTDETDESKLLEAVATLLQSWPRYCIPKRIVLEHRDWSVDDGLLSQKGSVVRRAVLEKYRLRVGSLYRPSFGRRQDALQPGQPHQQTGSGEDERNGVQQ